MTENPDKQNEEQHETLDFEQNEINVGPNIFDQQSQSNGTSKNCSYYDSESYYAEDSQSQLANSRGFSATKDTQVTLEFVPKYSQKKPDPSVIADTFVLEIHNVYSCGNKKARHKVKSEAYLFDLVLERDFTLKDSLDKYFADEEMKY